MVKSDDGEATTPDISSSSERPRVAGCCEAFIGNLRVQTLSPTLVRVEPEGPMGFEDRPTFMVTMQISRRYHIHPKVNLLTTHV